MSDPATSAGDPPDASVRVLVLIKGLGLGGAERLLVDVLANSDRRRFHYEVAYVLHGHGELEGELESLGVPVHPLGARASWDLTWVARLRSLLQRGHFDVLHSHLPYAAAFGRVVARSLPRQVRPVTVYTEHSLWRLAAVLTKALNRATIGFDSALVVVSPAAREALPPSLRSRAVVIVHGVDLGRSAALLEKRDVMRAEMREAIGATEGDQVAITVANIRAEKGYDVLLEAASILSERGIAVRFVSVGAGSLDADLQALSSSLQHRNFVFLGPRPDTLRLMAGSDIFVLPSHQEGMPVALMEALSLGLPVVATTVGGVPDLVHDGVEGLLVPPGRPAELADAISRLLSDRELASRLGAAALAGSRQLDVAQASRKIEALYSQLLSERRHS